MGLFNRAADAREYDYELTQESFGAFMRCVNTVLIGSLAGTIGAKALSYDCKTILVSGAIGAVVGYGVNFVYEKIRKNKLRARTGTYSKR